MYFVWNNADALQYLFHEKVEYFFKIIERYLLHENGAKISSD